MKTRLWFAGTPDFAAYSLSVLNTHPDYQIDGVLTQPDRPAGRGRKLSHSAVKAFAIANNIPVAQPAKLKHDDPPFPDLPRPDLIIVAAYGLLLPQWFLDFPRLGCLNIHASLLPRWRGAAPIQRAIEAGDKQTGICIMQMDAGLDTGAIWLEKSLPIYLEDNSAILHDRLMVLGAQTLLEALPVVISGKQKPTAQTNQGITYAHKLTKAEAAVCWQENAEAIARKIRAFNPFPVAYAILDQTNIRFYTAEPLPEEHHTLPGTVLNHNKKGIEVATGKGILRITTLQLPGKAPVTAGALRNSRDLTGKIFL